MKKSISIPLCGIILVFMVLQVMSNKKEVYVKTKHNDIKEEAIEDFIGYINVYENIKDKNGYSTYGIPKEFNESLSFRYRTYINNDDLDRKIFGDVPLIIKYELKEIEEPSDDKEFDYIKNKYENSFKLIEGYEKGNDISYYHLTGQGVSLYKIAEKDQIKEDGTIDTDEWNLEEDYYIEDISLYLVVVDEGEGYVVDYYERTY